MPIQIKSNLFPIPDSHYLNDSGSLKEVNLSIFGLYLQIAMAKNNLLKASVKYGHYFFRGFDIPCPRPATVLAWKAISHLGHRDSPYFLVPFLPSLREEDETGTAIGERGIHLASLSRRSGLHHKDETGRISWGMVYGGDLRRDVSDESILVWGLARSDATESQLVTGDFSHPSSGQDSIRTRLEFLSQYGIPACHEAAIGIGLPIIRRVLFQHLSQTTAKAWAWGYSESLKLIAADPLSAVADFRLMIHEELEDRKTRKDKDEFIENEKGNIVLKNSRFGIDLSKIDL